MLVEVSGYVPGEFQDYSLVQMLPDLQKPDIIVDLLFQEIPL